MHPVEILVDLRRRGLRLRLRDQGATLWAEPRGLLTENDRALIRQHRAALVSLLLAEQPRATRYHPMSAWGDRIAYFLDDVGGQLAWPALVYDDPRQTPAEARHTIDAGRPAWRVFCDDCLFFERMDRLETAIAVAEASLVSGSTSPVVSDAIAPSPGHGKRPSFAQRRAGAKAAARARVFADPDRPHYRALPTCYVSPMHGEGVGDDGFRFSFRPGATLHELLDAVPDRYCRVYLTGEVPLPPGVDDGSATRLGRFLAWVADTSTDDARCHWLQDREAGNPRRRGHYLSSEAVALSVLRFVSRETGRRIEVRHFACWVGEQMPATPAQARQAMQVLEELLRDSFPGAGTLLGTPTMTGRDLWQATEIAGGRRYELLPGDLQATLLAHLTQPRVELLGKPSADAVVPAGAVYLDARLAYAGAMRNLGVGLATHDSNADYVLYTPGFYRISGVVPRDWQHPGLVPTQQNGQHAEHGWSYPSQAGVAFTAWLTDAEMTVLMWPFAGRCPACTRGRSGKLGTAPCPEHGWPHRIEERILLTSTTTGPLNTWRDRLVRLHQRVEGDLAAERFSDPHIGHLLLKMLRALLLHTLGGFAARPMHAVTRFGTRQDAAAAHAHNPVPVGSHDAYWNEETPLPASDSDFLAAYRHPEWALLVWGRQRARLLSGSARHPDNSSSAIGLLSLPPGSAVAAQTDALLVTSDPFWPDDGQPGRFRIKKRLLAEAPWPEEWLELEAVKHAMTPMEERLACCSPDALDESTMSIESEQ